MKNDYIIYNLSLLSIKTQAELWLSRWFSSISPYVYVRKLTEEYKELINVSKVFRNILNQD